MAMSLTKLRANLYKIVDQVIATGIPIEIERKGVIIKLVTVKKRSKLSNLRKHPGTLIGDPEKIVYIDWSNEWNKGKIK